MSTIETFIAAYQLYRERTLDLLQKIELEPDPTAVLRWQPQTGRANIGWQLTHIGVTEELFATERLAPPKTPAFGDLVPRFKFGSTPDQNVPAPAEIRRVLNESREHLIATLREIGDEKLDVIFPAMAARKLTVLGVLHILGWHEAHHQGQAHLTLNMYKNKG